MNFEAVMLSPPRRAKDLFFVAWAHKGRKCDLAIEAKAGLIDLVAA